MTELQTKQVHTESQSSLKRRGLLRALKGINILLSVGVFIAGWCLCYAEVFSAGLPVHGVIFLLYAVCYVIVCRIYCAWDIGFSSVKILIYSICLSALICDCAVYVLACVGWWKLASVVPMLLVLAAQCVFTVIWSFCADRVYFRLFKPRNAAVIYCDEADLVCLHELNELDRMFTVERYVQNPDSLGQVLEAVKGCEAVFMIGVDAGLRNSVVEYCIDNDVQGYVVPHTGDVILAGATYVRRFSIPVMNVHRASPSLVYIAVKRAFDIVSSLLAILVLSPLMAVVALAIKLEDRGPVLYKQTRLTQNAREFEIWKFRSMRTDAEGDGVARLATENDGRITRVGRVIRATRLDELPQLFNILKGEMSVVGPRPERPEIAAVYEQEMPEFRLRLQVKAGLTGLAQVYGRYNTEPRTKLKMDLMYINRMSPWEDLKLIFATVKILFMKESTQGFESEEAIIFNEVQELD